nr:MAG TPA: hypothetical protein [Microviridae sp.]
MLLFVLLSLLLTSLQLTSVDKYKTADFRYANCPYRDIIGCNNFMCVDCVNSTERYNYYLRIKNHQNDDWQIFKQYFYEKNYPFPQESSTCPF